MNGRSFVYMDYYGSQKAVKFRYLDLEHLISAERVLLSMECKLIENHEDSCSEAWNGCNLVK